MEHVLFDPNEPGEECTHYGTDSIYKTYAECVMSEHVTNMFPELGCNMFPELGCNMFPELGCNIPWISTRNLCQGVIKTSYNDKAIQYVREVIKAAQIARFFQMETCKVPCLKMVVISKEISTLETINGL